MILIELTCGRVFGFDGSRDLKPKQLVIWMKWPNMVLVRLSLSLSFSLLSFGSIVSPWIRTRFTIHFLNFYFSLFLIFFLNFFELMVEIESCFLQLPISTIHRNCIGIAPNLNPLFLKILSSFHTGLED